MNAYVSPPTVCGLEPTLPSSWYRSDRAFALEKERIFCREWLCVGRAEEWPAPGASRVLDVLGESIIVVRNRESQIRAFYNVCRHRGSRLNVTAGRIMCPYHQWTYDLEGRLLTAPYLTSEPCFDKSGFSL
jgi:Rieske 2Fe-2S family protein